MEAPRESDAHRYRRRYMRIDRAIALPGESARVYPRATLFGGDLKRSIGTSMRGLGRQKYAARRTGNQVSSRRLAV